MQLKMHFRCDFDAIQMQLKRNLDTAQMQSRCNVDADAMQMQLKKNQTELLHELGTTSATACFHLEVSYSCEINFHIGWLGGWVAGAAGEMKNKAKLSLNWV